MYDSIDAAMAWWPNPLELAALTATTQRQKEMTP
jgi:hypothetical protein